MADDIHAPKAADSREALLERVAFLSASALNLFNLDEQGALDEAKSAYALISEIYYTEEAAIATLNVGIICHRVGNDLGIKYITEALEIFLYINNFLGLQKSYRELGHLNLTLGNYPEAEKNLRISLEISEKYNNEVEAVDTLNLLAGVYHNYGRYNETRDTLDKLIHIYRINNNHLGVAKLACNLGMLLTSLGEYNSALHYLSESYDILTNVVSDDTTLCKTLNNLGRLFYEINDIKKAIDFFSSALKNSTLRHDKNSEATILLNIAVAYRKNDILLSKRYFIESIILSSEIQNTGSEILALAGLAEILIQENQGPKALENLLNALPIAEELQDLETQLEILNLLGQAYALTGQWPEAEHSLKQGLELAQEVGRPKAVLEAHKSLYEHFKQRGDLERALSHFEQFYTAERALLTEESDKRVRELSAKFDLERAQQETQLERLLRATAEDARNAALEQVAERTLELEQAQMEIVSRLALAAEFRDDITGEHTLRVGRYSAAIARRMGLDSLEVALIEQAARLHDVGKIGVPDSILLKPGNLTPAEYEFMKAHTLMGGRILSGGHSRLVKMAEAVANSHHERWDGAGYPQGLSGEHIPLEGRIVAVADVFDALKQGRPYKKAWSKEEAWTELNAQSGKQFDPAIVEIFGRLLEEGVDEFNTFLGQHP